MKRRRLARAVSRHDFGGFAGFVVHTGWGDGPLSRSPTRRTQPPAAPITNRIHMANTSAVPTPARPAGYGRTLCAKASGPASMSGGSPMANDKRSIARRAIPGLVAFLVGAPVAAARADQPVTAEQAQVQSMRYGMEAARLRKLDGEAYKMGEVQRAEAQQEVCGTSGSAFGAAGLDTAQPRGRALRRGRAALPRNGGRPGLQVETGGRGHPSPLVG